GRRGARRDRHRDEAGHEPSDGSAPAGGPDRARHLPEHPGSPPPRARRRPVPPLAAAAEVRGRGLARPQVRARLPLLRLNRPPETPFMATSEQLEIKALAHEFAAGELRPHTAAWDESRSLGEDVFGKLAELGFLGMLIGEEHGGLGFDLMTYLMVL